MLPINYICFIKTHIIPRVGKAMVGQQREQIKRSFFIKLSFFCVIFFIFFTQSLRAELTDFAFKLGLLEKVAGEKTVEDFYQNRNFRPLWIGQGPAATERRTALFLSLIHI